MIIGIDGNEANVANHVGVSVYTLQLLNYFQKYSSKEIQFKVYLKKKPASFMPPENDYYKYTVVHGPVGWSQIFLPLHLHLNRSIDLFFSPAHYAPRHCPVPFVVTVHDLSHFYYPEEFLKKDLYKLRAWTEYSVYNAAKIIAVSKTTKKDIMKFYKIPEEIVQVVYNGYEKLIEKNESDLPPSYRDITKTDDYILYVGTIQPRKNIAILLKAFSQFVQTHPSYKLILVGKKGWLYEKIFEEVITLNLTESVIFTGFLPDQTVSELYKHSLCYVLPSLYEGFGIPVLEAMANEAPVIASYASSLPEIGGEACLYFDPKNAQDLTDKLSLLKNNTSLRNELIHKGSERITSFSWENCGKETLNTLIDSYKKYHG